MDEFYTDHTSKKKNKNEHHQIHILSTINHYKYILLLIFNN